MGSSFFAYFLSFAYYLAAFLKLGEASNDTAMLLVVMVYRSKSTVTELERSWKPVLATFKAFGLIFCSWTKDLTGVNRELEGCLMKLPYFVVPGALLAPCPWLLGTENLDSVFISLI